jgi:hypothetical protein
MEIEIDVLDVLQFRLVLHTFGTVRAQHSDVFSITSCVRKRRAVRCAGPVHPNSRSSMINQADQMRGNLTIDRVVSFILSSLIIALPFLALLLIKYPLGTP